MLSLLHLFYLSHSRHPHQPSPPTVHCRGATFSRSQLWASRRCSNALKPPSIRKRTVPTLSALRGSNGWRTITEVPTRNHRRGIFGDYHRTSRCMLVQTPLYVKVFADKQGRLRGPHLKPHQIISCATSLQLCIYIYPLFELSWVAMVPDITNLDNASAQEIGRLWNSYIYSTI